VNLVAREQAVKFSEMLSKGYQSEIGYQPEIYITRASNGAGLLS